MADTTVDDATLERVAEVAKRSQERTAGMVERAWKFIEGTGILEDAELEDSVLWEGEERDSLPVPDSSPPGGAGGAR